MSFDPSIIWSNAPLFLNGALLTMKICILALVLGYLLGILLAWARIAAPGPVKLLVGICIVTVRSVPFIIVLFVVHYGLPFTGVRLPAIVTGTLSLAAYAAIYYAEVVRAAYNALPTGQYDSARVIGMSPAQAIHHVVAPQILRAIVPPSTNVTLTMMKESAVLSTITVPELSYQGLVVQGNTFAPFEVFAAVATLYWLISWVTSELARRIERRAGQVQAQQVAGSDIAARYLSLDRHRASS